MSKRIQHAVTFEETINKSRFLTHLHPIDNEAAALELIKSLSVADATHNCWALIVGQVKRFNDDGEPAGTAGRPMLNILEAQQLDYVLALCTRWYGGIKLGTGGLIRAYGNGVKQCLELTSVVEHIPHSTLQGFCPYNVLDLLKTKLLNIEAHILHEEFGSDGVELIIKVPEMHQSACKSMLLDFTKGQFSFRLVLD